MEPQYALSSVSDVLDKVWWPPVPVRSPAQSEAVPKKATLPLPLQFGQENFLSESALEAIQAGRAEVAATLVDLGEACLWAVVLQAVAWRFPGA